MSLFLFFFFCGRTEPPFFSLSLSLKLSRTSGENVKHKKKTKKDRPQGLQGEAPEEEDIGEMTSSDRKGVVANPDLCRACSLGDLSAVLRLVVLGHADVNMSCAHGESPLFIACEKGHILVARLLQLNGADVNKADSEGASPLTIASFMGNTDIVKFLLENGGDPNQPMRDNTRPLYLACQQSHKDVAALLLAHGSLINESNDSGRNALSVALLVGHDELTTFLLERGAAATDSKVRRAVEKFLKKHEKKTKKRSHDDDENRPSKKRN